MLFRSYAMAEKVLNENRDGMVKLAELLLEREVVFTEDVEHIFGKRKKDIARELAEKQAAEQTEEVMAEQSEVATAEA